MSVTAPSTAAALKERGALATRRICEVLELGVVPSKQLTYLAIALTEAATEEIRHNQALRTSILALYQGLLPPPRITSTRSGGATAGTSGRSGAGGTRGGSSLAPGNPPNLNALVRNFSPQERPGALRKYGVAALKKAVPAVQEQYPGTAPSSMKKEAIVEYLLEHLPE